jgi:polysaccharide biosynthesis/export protein
MRIFFFIAFVALCLSACRTQKATGINYLENIRDTTITGLPAYKEPVIQKNDLLSIAVYSASIIPSTDAPYNLPQSAQAAGTEGPSFLVSNAGTIEYPRLGTLRVEGLTKTELAELIKSKLSGTQLTNPSVIIRFLNYKITVLGEVARPGVYTFPSERVTVLDALGIAGDVTEFGKRNTVKIWREGAGGGSSQVATIDLSSKNMFTSPYYVLQKNDVVMVEQTGEQRTQRTRQNTAQQIGVITGIVTTIALILNFIK